MESHKTTTMSHPLSSTPSLDRKTASSAPASDLNEQRYREAFSKACRCIGTQLRQFEDELSSQLVSDNDQIDRVLKYVARLGGKRLRPALTFLTSELF
ncbi:MAG: hypothetical protein ACKOAH_17180, partial [Pirellula sp.]